MLNFERRVSRTIVRHGLLRRGQKVVAALSGGPDSVALLLSLLALSDELSLSVSAAHLNHQLRGADAEADQAFVERLCGRLEVPLKVRRQPVKDQAAAAGANLEDFARRLRYEFLFEAAAEHGAVVATGHTLNDQAETLLMKLFRGAGLTGLSGIYPRRENRRGDRLEIRVVRPLLECSRAEVLDYLERKGQDYCADATNADLSIERNWVRHQLVPQVERKLNPNLVQTVARTAVLLRETADYLESEVERLLPRCRLEEERGPALLIEELKQLPPILQRQLVRRTVEDVAGSLQGLQFAHVEAVLELAGNSSGKKVRLPKGIEVVREFSLLRVGPAKRVPEFSYLLNVPGEIFVKEVGRRVTARRGPGSEAGVQCRLRLAEESLMVRNRRPGDRYHPRPGSSPKRLKELLIKQRIPAGERDRLLILESRGRVIWVEGFEPDPQFRAGPDERHAVKIEVRLETLKDGELLKVQTGE